MSTPGVDTSAPKAFSIRGQLNPVAKIDDSGNMIERYVYADKGNVPVYIIQGGTT